FPAAPSDVAAFRRAHGIPTNAFVFGCVARPDPLKWPGFMFEAFEEVARAHPSAFFVGAGFDDTARARIAAFPEDVRRRVVELPFLHDDEVLRTCYSAMDVFLHGSPIGETFGLVFGEALLCGTPIVTHSTPARHNSQLGVVGHERGGLVAASERYVAVAMARLLTTPALVEQLARRGSEYVRQHYTEEHVIPLLLRVIGHAQQASSRAALGAALGADPGIVTHVPDEHVRSLLANTLGRTPLRARILMRLVHKPALFRAWWAIKGRLRRQPDTDPAMPPSASVSASVSDHA
ncbi:MAG: glycosyltransferase family 4 protein, partial [Bacteroidota bacterium]